MDSLVNILHEDEFGLGKVISVLIFILFFTTPCRNLLDSEYGHVSLFFLDLSLSIKDTVYQFNIGPQQLMLISISAKVKMIEK